MMPTLRIFIPGASLVHRADARVKLVLLLVFSVGVFFVSTWKGLGLYALAVAGAMVAAKLPFARFCKLSVPLLVVLAFVWACNAFALDVGNLAPSGLSGVSAGFAAGWAPVALVGRFGFVPEGCMFALFYAARIMLILFASFVVTFTTPAEALTSAFSSLMRPLRHLRVPVDDAATMLSIAVRFIPLTAEELVRVRNAQASRGAQFEAGGLWQRIFQWRTVFIPLVVRLFRRADVLGESMEARCYGMGPRSSLNAARLSAAQIAGFVVCAAALLAVACLL